MSTELSANRMGAELSANRMSTELSANRMGAELSAVRVALWERLHVIWGPFLSREPWAEVLL
jgi:hypothetical protein